MAMGYGYVLGLWLGVGLWLRAMGKAYYYGLGANAYVSEVMD